MERGRDREMEDRAGESLEEREGEGKTVEREGERARQR